MHLFVNGMQQRAQAQNTRALQPLQRHAPQHCPLSRFWVRLNSHTHPEVSEDTRWSLMTRMEQVEHQLERSERSAERARNAHALRAVE